MELEESIAESLQGPAKRRDVRLRTVQSGLAAAATTVVKSLDLITNLQEEDIQDGVKQAMTHLVSVQMDGLKFLAYANANVNNIRKDSLKSGLQARYQSLAKDGPTVDSPFLFGGNLADKVKTVNEGTRVMKSRPGFKEYGHYHYGYPAGGKKFRYKMGRQQAYQPYGYAYPGYGYQPRRAA